MGALVRLVYSLVVLFRAALIALALSILLAGASAPAAAQTAVDLQLVLAVDASGSVSEERFELQKQGYVAAFRSPALLRAVGSGAARGIAVTMVQWTGPAMQVQVVPWRLVNDEASMLAAAAAIEAVPRQLFGGGTSISGAIDHAKTAAPEPPLRRRRAASSTSPATAATTVAARRRAGARRRGRAPASPSTACPFWPSSSTWRISTATT